MTKWLAIGLVFISANTFAWNCKFESKLDQTLDVSESEILSIAAAAGDLEITGVEGTNEVVIRGKVCVSEEDWLKEVRVEASTGKQAEITVSLPDSSGWSLLGNRYAYVDLKLEVPGDLAINLRDSSGDIEIEDVAALTIKDSSGDIEVTGASGKVEITDSSGDIRVFELEGDFTIISDSSGDIRGSDIKGNVLVQSDSSGDIRFSRVGHDVVVERDSSGDIKVDSVGGDFRVLKDGSGSIHSKDVEGEIVIPAHKS